MTRLRTFIAVELDEVIRERIIALQQKLARTGAEIKWAEQENLHITLLFLGEVDAREVPALCNSVTTVCQNYAPFQLSVATAGCFPNLRHPRILWVGVTEGAETLVKLHDELEVVLLELGCYRREDRPYTPHITLGRVKSEAPTEMLSAALTKEAGALTKQAAWLGGTCTVCEVHVMSSELTPKGPQYTVLSRAKLKGS